MQRERLLSDTMQVGGRIVFLQENSGPSVESWKKTLDTSNVCCGVVFSEMDLKSGRYATCSQDLIFVFEHQISLLMELDAILQGQRVLIGGKDSGYIQTGWVDYIWDLSLAGWGQLLVQVKDLITGLGPIPNFIQSSGRPCLFLDRDDVLVPNVPYNRDPEKVRLTSGITSLISQAHDKGWWVALVTNQSGLGRGMISWEDYQQVHQRMLKLLAEEKCWIDECVWASYIEESAHPAGRFYPGLRKPRGGMFQLVDDKLKVNRDLSVMIGDSASDLMAAYHAGIKKLLLLETARASQEAEQLYKAQALLPKMNFTVIKSLDEVVL